MINKEPKYVTDYFVYKKKNHWFIIPTVVVSYNKYEFWETGVQTPAFGISIRWFQYMVGFVSQRNAYYNVKPQNKTKKD